MNQLQQLSLQGQSIWLDYIERQLLASGGLMRLMAEDGIRGVTSNPAIFEKAIASDPSYRSDLEELRGRKLAPADMLERLVVPDIRAAADQLYPVYQASAGQDGFVSLEVAPALAHDAEHTLSEARRLSRIVERANLMIKVPATDAALPAISQLIFEGINVNATLLFSQAMHARVMEAYLTGLERRAAAGLPLDSIAGVASFFVSRIDTEVDKLLAARLDATDDASTRDQLQALMGQAAIANAKLAYRNWKAVFSGARWQKLAQQGARSQRLLWASTGVKNPAYRDVRYIEELIGPDTVNTVPPATLDAFLEHGGVRATLEENVDAATGVLEQIEAQGISMDDVTDKLLDAGVLLFVQAYDKLVGSLAR